MNLNITWEGPDGPGVNYRVDYRPYPSTEEFFNFSTNTHDTFAVIPNLPDGFYEVRISTICSNGPSGFMTKIGGKPTCPLPVYQGYEVRFDRSNTQIIRINFSDANDIVKVRVTNLNTNAIIREEEVADLGFVDFTLPKSSLEPLTYKIEIANSCVSGDSLYVNMGEYTVQKIQEGFSIGFESTCSCTGAKLIQFKDTTTSELFYDPEFLPTGTYDLQIQVENTACLGTGTMLVELFSNEDILPSFEKTSYPNGSFYVYVFNGIDFKTGSGLGTHLTDVDITFSCE